MKKQSSSNRINKIIDIGVWSIGVISAMNVVVLAILGFLAYKYIYVDMVLSKYNGDNSTKQVMLDNLRYAKQTEILYHNVNNTLFDSHYKPRMYGVFCDDIDLKLFDDLINNPIVSSNYYFDEKSVVVSDIKYLGDKVIKGYLNKNSNCNNISFTVVGNEKEVLKISIGYISSYARSFMPKLHRINENYKIINEFNDRVIYANLSNNVVIDVKNSLIDIYYPSYFNKLRDIATKYYGSFDIADKNMWFIDYNNNYSYNGFKDENAKNFYTYISNL